MLWGSYSEILSSVCSKHAYCDQTTLSLINQSFSILFQNSGLCSTANCHFSCMFFLESTGFFPTYLLCRLNLWNLLEIVDGCTRTPAAAWVTWTPQDDIPSGCMSTLWLPALNVLHGILSTAVHVGRGRVIKLCVQPDGRMTLHLPSGGALVWTGGESTVQPGSVAVSPL